MSDQETRQSLPEDEQIADWLIRKTGTPDALELANARGFAKAIAADIEGFARDALGLSDPFHEWCGYDPEDL